MVVHFHNQALKEEFINKFKEIRSINDHLTSAKVNKIFPANKIYLNDHLSSENKRFLTWLKNKGRELNYAFVWCYGCKFVIRKMAHEEAISQYRWWYEQSEVKY